MPTQDALNAGNATSFLGFNVWFGTEKGIEEAVQTKFSRTEQWVRVKLVCKSTDAFALQRKLLGGSVLTGGVIVTTAPYVYPPAPWMIVSEVTTRLIFGNTGTLADVNGFVSSKYTGLDIEFTQLDPLDLGEESIEFSARMLTAPTNLFRWKTDNAPLSTTESPGIIECRASLRRSVNRQPTIPLGLIYSLLGHVNGAAFLGGDAGTMLYLGCTTRRNITSLGVKNWDISHAVDFTKMRWNWFLRTSLAAAGAALADCYAEVVPHPYPDGDLTQLGIHTDFGVPTSPSSLYPGGGGGFHL